MGNKREIKLVCNCGSIMIEGKAKFQHLETEAMVCPKCNYTTLTRGQAEKYVKIIR
jgi:ssDNA-binding Zn-finger/Zn-ribbon topoisomerase 1